MKDNPLDPNGLDELLGLDPPPVVPPDLAQRVLRGLRDHEERTLDTLLEMDARSQDLVPPSGLAARIVARVRAEAQLAEARHGAAQLDAAQLDAARLGEEPVARRTPARWKLLRGAPLVRLAAAGLFAATVVGVARQAWLSGGDGASDGDTARAVPANGSSPGGTVPSRAPGVTPLGEPTSDLLAALPALEHWELLTSDLDPLELDTIMLLDAEDEVLLDLAADENG